MLGASRVLLMTMTGHDFCGSKPCGTAIAIRALARRGFPAFAASARCFAESGTSRVKTSPDVGVNLAAVLVIAGEGPIEPELVREGVAVVDGVDEVMAEGPPGGGGSPAI